MYMVRAGRDNYLFDQFKEKGLVAIGWNIMGDISSVDNVEELKAMLGGHYQDYKPQAVNMFAGQINRFVQGIRTGDYVVTYSSEERIYLIGQTMSGYVYDTSFEYHQTRKVKWLGSVMRDSLSVPTKNSLGSIAAVFEIKGYAREELLDKLSAKSEAGYADEQKEELESIKDDVEERAREFIKDKIMRLSWDEMQELTAAILRSLGFKTRVSPKGADRGKDIIASPDGLGLEEPRIVVEVKHRKGYMGAPEIRSFIGGIRSGGCKGIYVSTGGFSREAKYEAERAPFSLTLIDIDYLVDLIIANYDNFDLDGKALIPLRKIYWPV